MSLQWRKSPESVGHLALRRTSLLGVASGYTSSILVLKQVTGAGMIRVLQRLLAVIGLPTCALCILHDNTDIHQCVAILYVDTTANTRTNRAAAAQLTAAYCCIHCYDCKTRDHGTLYTLDNRFQVNIQSIGSYSNRRPIVACDRYRLALLTLVVAGNRYRLTPSLIYCSANTVLTCNIKNILETDGYR